MTPPAEAPRHPWIVAGPAGLAYVGLHDSEDSVWQIYLGWPSEDEIRCAKQQGFYAVKANLNWIKPRT